MLSCLVAPVLAVMPLSTGIVAINAKLVERARSLITGDEAQSEPPPKRRTI